MQVPFTLLALINYGKGTKKVFIFAKAVLTDSEIIAIVVFDILQQENYLTCFKTSWTVVADRMSLLWLLQYNSDLKPIKIVCMLMNPLIAG